MRRCLPPSGRRFHTISCLFFKFVTTALVTMLREVNSIPHPSVVSSVPHQSDVSSVPHQTGAYSLPHWSDVSSVPHQSDVSSVPHQSGAYSLPHWSDVSSVPNPSSATAPPLLPSFSSDTGHDYTQDLMRLVKTEFRYSSGHAYLSTVNDMVSPHSSFGRDKHTNSQPRGVHLIATDSLLSTSGAKVTVTTVYTEKSLGMSDLETRAVTHELETSQPEVGTTPSQHRAHRHAMESHSSSVLQVSPQTNAQRHSSDSPGMDEDDDVLKEDAAVDRDSPLPGAAEWMCEPRSSIIAETEGTISWTDPDVSCGEPWIWFLTVPEDHGLSFQFTDVKMSSGKSLQIQSYDTDQQRWSVERVFHDNDNVSASKGTIDHSPLLTKRSQVRIIADMDYKQEWNTTASYYNLSFFSQPKNTTPDGTAGWDLSLVQYDCSLGPVPKALLCNMVPECMFGEDEENCTYRETGCEKGWIPYRHQCLRAEFFFSCLLFPCQLEVGNQHPTLTERAEHLCESWYDAELASFPDVSGIHLVTSIIRQSGFRSVSLKIMKFRPVNKKIHGLYRYTWQWGGKGGPVAYDWQELEHSGAEHNCAMLDVYPKPHFVPTDCSRFTKLLYPDGFVCSKRNPNFHDTTSTATEQQVAGFDKAFFGTFKGIYDPTFKECSDGSLVHMFERCLWGDMRTGAEWSPNNFALFQCRFGAEVHYSLVCDGNENCADGSDEDDCRPFTLQVSWLRDRFLVCENHQLLKEVKFKCNGVVDCFDGTDEEGCQSCYHGVIFCPVSGCIHTTIGIHFPSCPQLKQRPVREIPVPGVVNLDRFGVSEIDPVIGDDRRFLYECSPELYLPSYLLANGEKDCTDGRDEEVSAENIVCPGYYRCSEYGICVHPNHLCDGIYHCPNHDDELYCLTITCPDNCTCEGYAYACSQMFDTFYHPDLRYLDLSGVKNISFETFHVMELLRFLNLSHCSLSCVNISGMVQLKILDLSFNDLAGLSSLRLSHMNQLTYLDLSGNPFVRAMDSTFTTFVTDSGLFKLETLMLKRTYIHTIQDKAFEPLSQLLNLDIRDSPVQNYDKDVFSGLTKLAVLRASDPKLCCAYFHPHEIRSCDAPVDELSSCSDLLRTHFFRAPLWIFSAFAISGNLGVIIYRFFFSNTGPPVFRVLVINLCVSDLLMGVYMVMVGAADVHFKDVYVSVEKEWRQSAVCTLAGVLAFLSCEASNFIIGLITLDRFIVLTFPFKKHLHMKVVHSAIVCSIAWAAAVTLAVIPLISDLHFYEQTAVCLPLPVTRHHFPGYDYAFGVFIVLNFVLTLLIGCGQLLIYRAVSQESMATGSRPHEQDATVARHLFLVVFSDICCWLPIGIMGMVAAAGTPISGEVHVWTTVFLLPINSALNPFLYTLNRGLERRRKQRLEAQMKRMIGNLQHVIPTWNPETIAETARICIKTRHVSWDKLHAWMGGHLKGRDVPAVATKDEARGNTV